MAFQGEARDPLEHTSLYQRAESEESDEEGGLGNVSKLVMRPAEHSGKAKKGHLCFDASFETGNLGRVDLVSEFEYDLFIRPDTCSPRLRFWFNFTVDNVRADQRVVLNIVNISKTANLFRRGMTPLVKSTSRPKWQRIPQEQVFYYKSAQHQDHYVLSFAFSFDREEDVYQFCLTYPYSYSRCLEHLENLCRRQACAKQETLALSVQKRKIEMVTIGSKELAEPTERRKRVVVVLARVHPSESPTSFVCQGLMDFLVSSHPIAQVLRDHVTFKIVPMLNPDGVFLGNHRSTLMGQDLNRSWNRISQWIHPSLVAVKSILESLDEDVNTPLDCVLDLHAHSNAMGVFTYGNTYDDVYRYERHIVLPKLLAQHAEDYEPANNMYNQDSHKAGTARRYLSSILKEHVNCYTIQVSMHGYSRKAIPGILPYAEEGFYRLGRNIAHVFFEYYKLTGLISLDLPNQPSSKRGRRSRQRQRLPCQPRSRTARTPAPLHYASIHEYFLAESTGARAAPPAGAGLEARSVLAGLAGLAGRESLGGARYRSMSGTRMSEASTAAGSRTGVGGGRNRSYRFRSPGAPLGKVQALTRRPAEPARLAIIDFNQLTRGGLDLATRGNSAKVDVGLRGKPRR